jgi:hypothetical protein
MSPDAGLSPISAAELAPLEGPPAALDHLKPLVSLIKVKYTQPLLCIMGRGPPGVRRIRPLIGRQYALGHKMRMLLTLCDRATALGHAHLTAAQAVLRTKSPKLVREHIISMNQLTVLFINSRGKTSELC